jgi:2-polyprenyl-6-methoxyphenol hydroxylase-like FAD-dependent oxidoreductase
MRVLIVGAGIGGLSTALSLHACGADVLVVDSVRQLLPLGVGINIQPHAVRELTELGLGDALERTGIQTREMLRVDRHGNVIATHPRGRFAGYAWPQYSIHRGELQMLLLKAVLERLGPDSVRTGLAFSGFAEDDEGVEARLRARSGGEPTSVRADALVGADGIFSGVRRQLHPGEGDPLWNGIRMWRGIAEAPPFLTGRTHLVAGSHAFGRIVAYPVSRSAERRGRAMVNWVAELRVPRDEAAGTASWTREGRLEDVLPHFADWDLGWLDVPGLISRSPQILEYPMVDRDPLAYWSRGRVTLVGDAAHPMYPVGANGGSQAILDARVLALELSRAADPVTGLKAYEDARMAEANAVAMGCRAMAADRLLDVVAERAPDGFDSIEDVLSAKEIADMDEAMRLMTDMDVQALNSRPSWTPSRTF